MNVILAEPSVSTITTRLSGWRDGLTVRHEWVGGLPQAGALLKDKYFGAMPWFSIVSS
jgi:hypothetical protein